MSIQIFCPFVVSLLLTFKSSLYILDNSLLLDVICKYFLNVCGLSSHSLNPLICCYIILNWFSNCNSNILILFVGFLLHTLWETLPVSANGRYHYIKVIFYTTLVNFSSAIKTSELMKFRSLYFSSVHSFGSHVKKLSFHLVYLCNNFISEN